MEPKSQYRILCKNHSPDFITWTSLNPDGSTFDQQGKAAGQDKHVHLPAPSCNVRVQVEDEGQQNLVWCGSVNDGDHLVADGAVPVLTLTHNGNKVGPPTCV